MSGTWDEVSQDEECMSSTRDEVSLHGDFGGKTKTKHSRYFFIMNNYKTKIAWNH